MRVRRGVAQKKHPRSGVRRSLFIYEAEREWFVKELRYL